MIISYNIYANDTPPKYPWHLADIWWHLYDQKSIETLSVDFAISGQIDSSINLYIAPIGLTTINGISCYGGIQTNVNARQAKYSKNYLNLGFGGLFSRWSKNNQPISFDFAEGDENTYYESAGYEGEFIGVRKAFNWSEGKYTYTLSQDITLQEQGYIWLKAAVFDHQTQNEYIIGSLKFEGNQIILGDFISAFYEIYANGNIPDISVQFDDPKINGQTVNIRNIEVNYPDNDYKRSPIPRFSTAQRKQKSILLNSIPAGLYDEKHSENY